MIRTRKGLRSTKTDENEDDAQAAEEDMVPDEQACTAEDNEMFCYSITTDNNSNIIYNKLAGRFPIEPYTGMNYYFVRYVYKYKYIMVQIMKSRKDADMVFTFKEVHEELKTKGHQPTLHVLDNECSKAVEKCYRLTNTSCKCSRASSKKA